MATVRIHYSRADSNQSDYDLWHFKGVFSESIDHNDLHIPFSDRQKISFGDNNYVDIDLGEDTNVSWYIKRKDNVSNFNNKKLCNYGNLTCGPTCSFCWEIGFQWNIDLNITPQLEYFIDDVSPYIYKDAEHSEVLATGIALIGVEDLEGDGDNEIAVDDDKLRIFYSLSDFYDVDIPAEEIWYTKWEKWNEYYKTTINRIQLLYLLNKSYIVGENDMQLSIDADALQVEKDDAKQMLEKAVANSLFKLGEDVAAFDENVFLADVDGYKDTKNSSLHATIDYLKESLEALALLA